MVTSGRPPGYFPATSILMRVRVVDFLARWGAEMDIRQPPLAAHLAVLRHSPASTRGKTAYRLRASDALR